MCLGIPGRVTEVYDSGGVRMGKVDFGGKLYLAGDGAIHGRFDTRGLARQALRHTEWPSGRRIVCRRVPTRQRPASAFHFPFGQAMTSRDPSRVVTVRKERGSNFAGATRRSRQ